MSSRDDIMKNLSTALEGMPGNPNRPPAGPGPSRPVREPDGYSNKQEAEQTEDAGAVRVMTRESPSMATPRQADETPPAPEMSIAQSICRFSDEVARFLEREGDRILSEARDTQEKMHQFAATVRRTGAGGL